MKKSKSFADELLEQTNAKVKGSKKTKAIKQPKHIALAKWVDNKIMPHVSRALLVAGSAYALVQLLTNLDKLPDMVVGVIATVVIAYIVTRASR